MTFSPLVCGLFVFQELKSNREYKKKGLVDHQASKITFRYHHYALLIRLKLGREEFLGGAVVGEEKKTSR